MTQAAILAASGSPGTTTGFKNRIINGAMVIDQRNAGASVTPTANAFLLDRYQINTAGTGVFSVQQNAGSVTPPVGFANYLGITSLAATSVGAGDNYGIRQQIEGYNWADLGWGSANAPKTITLSFWVRSSLTGTFGGALENANTDRAYPFTYTISAANTWEYETITIAGDPTGTWQTGNGTGVRLWLSVGTGSTYRGTAGAWASADYRSATGGTSVVGTSGATWYITGIQIEVGTTATNFDYRSYGTELQLCQRYYETNNTNNGFWYTVRNDGISRGLLVFIVQKRAAPTVVLTAPAGAGNYTTLAGSLGTSTNTCDFGTSSNFSSFGIYTANAEL